MIWQRCIAVISVVVDGVIAGGVFHKPLHGDELDCVVLYPT